MPCPPSFCDKKHFTGTGGRVHIDLAICSKHCGPDSFCKRNREWNAYVNENKKAYFAKLLGMQGFEPGLIRTKQKFRRTKK